MNESAAKKPHSIKKILKYLSVSIIVLIVIALGLIAYVLHSESGTRFAVEQGIKWAELNITYDKLNGNLSDGLKISNFNYQSETIDIKAKDFDYISDWSWISRHLTLENVQVDQVIIDVKPATKPVDKSAPFSGLNLPLTVDIEQLSVNDLSWNILNTETTANNSETQTTESKPAQGFNSINNIKLKANINQQSAKISNLEVTAPEYELTTSGDVNFGSGLAFDLKTQWQLGLESNNQHQALAQEQQQLNIKGSGPIKGDLQQVTLNQELDIVSPQINGDYQLKGGITELTSTPRFDLQLQSEKTEVRIDEQNISITDLELELNGLIDDYQAELAAKIEGVQMIQSDADAQQHEKQQSISYPSSTIKLTASGNTEQISTENAQLVTPEGRIDLNVDAQWKPNLNISSQVNITEFNPEQILQNWSGLINGNINLTLTSSDQGIEIKTTDNQLTGELKGQEFALTGAANYASQTFVADQLRLELGENYLLVNGQVKPNNVDLSTELNWINLSTFSDRLSGEINGAVNLSGDYQNPNLNAQLNAQALRFDEQVIEQLRLESVGQLNKNLKTTINLEQAIIAGQTIDNAVINQSGWLDQHQVDLKLNAKNLSTAIKIEGQYDGAKAQNNLLWQGQLLEHTLTIETDKTIQLQDAIEVEIADLISIEKGCWQGVEAGQICIELNDIEKSNQNYQGSLTVDSFSLIPLQVFMPETVAVKGQLNGAADFSLADKDLSITSDLNLQNGEIFVYSSNNPDETIYQTTINIFEVKASTTNRDIDFDINLSLSDDSFIDLTAQISSLDDKPLEINSSLKGEFNNTEMIQSLTEEISELEGYVVFEGSIKGELTRPRISLDLSQPKGYVTLARLGTVIEELKLNVSTENISIPAYEIKFSGQNLADINQGNIESKGVFKLNDNDQWQYQGDIKGDNFMLLNLAEVKFNISPDLNIMATAVAAEIKGKLDIDSGQVTVKQLPASTVQISNDVVIHRTETEQAAPYPVDLDIKAEIKEPVKLDVVGLKSDLSGSIQLLQSNNQAIAGKGVMNLTGGSYEIYGQQLKIETGELTFTGPLDNPRLNVKASRESYSGEVTAGVELGGTVNNLRSTLFSNPSLSDIEKLSYIMTGRGMENSGGLDGEQLQQAAIVMGLNQSSPVFKQIQSQFGIDVLTVREAATTADTVVEAGKQLNEKLYVSYNQGLFNRLGFWLLKYRINDFLNLETTQGEDQSVELVYTRKAEIDTSTNEQR